MLFLVILLLIVLVQIVCWFTSKDIKRFIVFVISAYLLIVAEIIYYFNYKNLLGSAESYYYFLYLIPTTLFSLLLIISKTLKLDRNLLIKTLPAVLMIATIVYIVTIYVIRKPRIDSIAICSNVFDMKKTSLKNLGRITDAIVLNDNGSLIVCGTRGFALLNQMETVEQKTLFRNKHDVSSVKIIKQNLSDTISFFVINESLLINGDLKEERIPFFGGLNSLVGDHGDVYKIYYYPGKYEVVLNDKHIYVSEKMIHQYGVCNTKLLLRQDGNLFLLGHDGKLSRNSIKLSDSQEPFVIKGRNNEDLVAVYDSIIGRMEVYGDNLVSITSFELPKKMLSPKALIINKAKGDFLLLMTNNSYTSYLFDCNFFQNNTSCARTAFKGRDLAFLRNNNSVFIGGINRVYKYDIGDFK